MGDLSILPAFNQRYMSPKEVARQKIEGLVEKFASQPENYKNTAYNETLTRRDFIDPFFEALGWDINNSAGAWEAYREVIHEDRIKISGVSKAPDYSFRLLGGQRLFFVEAKKPSVHIKDDIAPAYQVRLYGWNAKLAISVVTDFEEFAIYDCSKKPSKTDKTSTARLNYFTYKDYLTQFDFIWDTFSREQVIKGGLIKFQRAEKKGTATVDKEFLNSLDQWRVLLAANISKNNPEINEDDLNYSVQQTIDRIIFLRIAEDRGLEPYGQLKSATTHDNYYKDLFLQFNQADAKYNSGLFHFRREKDNPTPEDKITGNLVIDNKVIKAIVQSLYPPESDFLFDVLPVEILGSAYEQFLGKQIVVGKTGKATIEEKPEVRKAGGVYYTPQYIVEYIVLNTVGKLTEGKTPTQVSKLKIVDPACGSGSFLLGAYQYLLNWHMQYYKANGIDPKKKNAPINQDGSLTTAEKKRILVNNLYGVDLDKNAVEVTKLSLLLKCMEGETMQTVNDQMKLLHERVLPSLENNIKCGNSLIDFDYYDGTLEFGGEMKIQPFSWQQNFKDLFKQGGFDAVIGNPPYGATVSKEILSYLTRKFPEVKKFPDTYCAFIVQATLLAKKSGYCGYIVPNTFCDLENCDEFRKWFLKQNNIQEIYQTGWAFKDAVVDTLVFLLKKESPSV